MTPAKDCTVDKMPENARKVNPTHELQSTGNQQRTTNNELFTTGGLADLMTSRRLICTRDTVDHFIKTRNIQPVTRHGNYRMFDQRAANLLQAYLQKLKRKRA